MQDSEPDHDSASFSIDDAEGPGPQETEAPEAEPKPFRPVSEMSAREGKDWTAEANRRWPKIDRRYS